MGELIQREAAATPQTFSGERLTAAISGQVEIEHYHRYLLAREFCRGRDVLDIAAGEGYGTALIAQVAKSAIGVEIDAETVAAATREFQAPNLRYEQGDARSLPLPTASVDVAVSFETLEHLAEQDEFLAELHRVLRPGGLLIISTPDRDAYSPIGAPPNPFHVRELTRSEFEALLARRFAHHAMTAQRAIIGSVILGGADGPLLSYEKRSDSHIEGNDHLPRAPYLLAFASDGALPVLPNSVYIYRSDIDTDPQTRFEAEMAVHAEKQASAEILARANAAEFRLANVEKTIKEGVKREANAVRVITDLERRLKASETLAEANKAASGHFEREAASAQHHLRVIEASSIWRATRPLRGVGAKHPGLSRSLRRGVKLAWWTCTLQLPRRYRSWRNGTPIGLPLAPAAALSIAPRGAADISIASSAEPVVSVIISTYGQVKATLACLQSIADHPPRWPIEVIVVDDAYPGPEDLSPLQEVKGIRFTRNPANLGFLLSCNEAAQSARGRYLHMLNNDTELLPDAIDALVDLLEARPDVGMAGSKLLFPDGTLQEAGGILWTDASGWNYGRGEDPSRPEYAYLREVDYCSGASIMLPRPLFESLGGFDRDYAPAYYEDVDLAFRIRAKGLKVLYEPRSVIIHHEGMSHGTDLASGVKMHQVTNQARILERWGATLARENYPNPDSLLSARDRGRTRKTILVVDHYAPEPDRDAGSRSTLGIMDSLVDAGWVVKFWPHNRLYSEVYTTALERRGIEVPDRRWPGNLAEWLRLQGTGLDHVLVVRPHVAADLLPQIIGNTDAVLSFYGVDLHFARVRRQATRDEDPALLIEADKLETLERRVWRSFDVVLYPSEEEATVVTAMAPRVFARGIVPFSFPMFAPRTVPTTGRTILFVAGFAHPPNVDAAQFLIREIMPQLEHEIGPVNIVLAGSNPTDAVRALAGSRVEVTGYVTEEALGELYESHRAAIVPLRFGAGVKGKVVEALSRGLPLVTTSIGSQGIPGLDAVVPVRDAVPGIVAALKLLLTDDEAWMAQSSAQMTFARRFFSAEAMQRSVLSALDAAEEAVRGHEASLPTDHP